MFQIFVRTKFSAAHYLPNYEGACQQMHGHTWKVELGISGDKLNEQGMLFDFSLIKGRIKSLFDHQTLNDISGLADYPTAENLAQFITNHINRDLSLLPRHLNVISVRVWESDDCYAEYIPEGDTWSRAKD